MTAAGGWYHVSVKTVSRSAGRSVVAAAAYRLAACLHDRETGEIHDYRRKGGVITSFTLAPKDAPTWAFEPERLWNAAELAEKRINSQTGRECELALPAAVSADEREAIARSFAEELVDRYGVAVTVALHEPSRGGDERNFHAHILMTTRRMEASGLGVKTRVLDDRKSGPKEVLHLRELACDLINAALERAGAAERVDHRSFENRGINKEPTEHLGPSATDIERQGGHSDRGDANRAIEERNEWLDELVSQLAAIDAAIAQEEENILDERYGAFDPRAAHLEPPLEEEPDAAPSDCDEPDPGIARTATEEEAQLDADAAPLDDQIRAKGEIRHEGLGEMNWWERAAAFGQWIFDTVGKIARNTWQMFIEARRGKDDRSNDGPDIDR